MSTLADYRLDFAGLLALALLDLDGIWVGIDNPDDARDILMGTLPLLTLTYGSAASTLAADWYDDYRDAADIGGSFRALPAELPDQGRTDALARWGIGPLFKAEPDYASAKTLVAGGFQRILANAGRETVMGSAVADPKAVGWQRVGDGDNCDFCDLLISRGAVYSEATADFASHDHCNCSAAPAFDGRPRPVKPYMPSARGSSAADRARVRAYLRTH